MNREQSRFCRRKHWRLWERKMSSRGQVIVCPKCGIVS